MNDIEVLENIKSMIIYDSDDDYENQEAIREIIALENAIKSLKERQSDKDKLNYKNKEIRRLEKEICDLQNQLNFYKKEAEKDYRLSEEKDKRIKELEKSKVTYERVRDIQEENKRIVTDEYIPKSLIKEKIEELKEEYKIALEENSTKAFILKCQIQILEELLNGKM